jgi:chromosome segregation ATPase
MPLFGGKEKNFWKIKELAKYSRKIDGSEIPPIYDLEKTNETHRDIDANIRPFWENLHPIIQDFITSWNDAWINLMHESEDLNSQLRQKNTLVSNLKSNFESKLRELNADISTLKADLQAKENEINQKEQLIKDLDAADKESQLGISQLRENLEKRLNKLNEEVTERQKTYEKTQMQVGQAFQQKVLELDSEILSLNEQVAEKDAQIKDKDDQIKILQKDSQKAKFYESKAATLENKINKIAEILEVEEKGEEEEKVE